MSIANKSQSSKIIQLGEKIVALVCNNNYQVNLIFSGKMSWRISSDQSIVLCSAIKFMEKTYMEKNAVVNYYYLIIVDRKFSWTITRVKDSNQMPERIYSGVLISEKYSLEKILGVIEIEKKLVFIFNDFQLLYIPFSEKDLANKHYRCSQFTPYGLEPEYQHEKYSVGKYLPNEEEYEALMNLFRKVSSEKGILLLVYKSKTNKLCSVYSLEFDFSKLQLTAGHNMLMNIQYHIIGIFQTENPYIFMIQTTQSIILWNISQEKAQSKVKTFSTNSRAISCTYKNGIPFFFIGASSQNQLQTIKINYSNISLDIDQLKELKLPQEHEVSSLYTNSKQSQFYFMTKRNDLYYSSKNETTKILSNENTSIVYSRLFLSENYNFILVHKVTGINKQAVIYGTHYFAYSAEHYSHGALLSNAKINYLFGSVEQVKIGLSSPLISGLELTVTLKKQKSQKLESQRSTSSIFEIIFDKNKSKDEILFQDNKFIIYPEEIQEIGGKSTKISSLFDEATQYISLATVIPGQFIVLSIADQLHFFNVKLQRKYIYCCQREIKLLTNLNDVNLIGVELFQSQASDQSQLLILVLGQQKAIKNKIISIPHRYTTIKLSTIINTVEYKVNLFSNKMVICSNDPLHKYQLEKIVIQDYQMPMPESNLTEFYFLPICSLSSDKSSNDFLLIFREEQCQNEKLNEQVQLYFCSINSKYLLKKLQLSSININFERIMTLSSLPKDNLLFSLTYDEQITKNNPSFKHLMIFGEKYASIFSIKFGRIQLEQNSTNTYIKTQFARLQLNQKQIISFHTSLNISNPISAIKTHKKQHYLIANDRQIYYTFCNGSKIQKISYYSLINDQFTDFRNNISVQQLGDESFMSIFNKKMVIKQIKYLSDSNIFILYETAIIVLEIGFNNSLIVRQELKFKSQSETQIIKIEEFLQNYDATSIYMRDFHGRIYILLEGPEGYKLQFHANIDEDVLLFSRLNNWNKRDRTYHLKINEQQNSFDEQLILKKDGQLVVKKVISTNQEQSKLIYL